MTERGKCHREMGLERTASPNEVFGCSSSLWFVPVNSSEKQPFYHNGYPDLQKEAQNVAFEDHNGDQKMKFLRSRHLDDTWYLL